MIDTSMYKVVRGAELLKSKGKEPPSTWIEKYDNGTEKKRSIGTHPHGLSMPRAIAPHKPLDASKWVALAQDTGPGARLLLANTYKQGAYSLACDIRRIHAVDGTLAGAIVCDPGNTWNGENIPDFMVYFPRNAPYRFTVATQALWSALHAVKPFARDSSKIVRFETSESALVVRATSNEYGDAQVTIDGSDYAATLCPHEFALASNFVLDALSGMGERVEVATHSSDGEQAFVFTSEVRGVTRKAVVMPMHISR